MPKPLISIIVPIYNVQVYLRSCIESILSQTYLNLEIILVDDGSTDDCPAICEEYAQKDNRIVVVHKKNGGLSDARNEGLKISKGEYITFVDSDDLVSKYFIETLYSAISLCSVKLAICLVRCFFDEQKLIDERTTTLFDIYDKKRALQQFCSLNFNKSTPFISACSKMYHRSLFDSISFPIGKIYEDVYAGYRIIDQVDKVVAVSCSLYYYRMRNDGIMGQKETHPYQDVLQPYQSAIEYFNRTNQSDLSSLFYPPLLMREMYRYWVAKIVGKNETIASEILSLYKQDVRKLKGTPVSNTLKAVFRILSWMPGVYVLYRKILPGFIGGR